VNTRGREDAERLTADVIELARHYGRYSYRKGGCLADRIDRRDYLGVMMISTAASGPRTSLSPA